MEKAAHAIKGHVANYGSKPVTKLASQLNELARSGEFSTKTAQLIERLDVEIHQLSLALYRYQTDHLITNST